MRGPRWRLWFLRPWDAWLEYKAYELACRVVALVRRYPALREWPERDLWSLAAVSLGWDQALTDAALSAFDAPAEHEAEHR